MCWGVEGDVECQIAFAEANAARRDAGWEVMPVRQLIHTSDRVWKWEKVGSLWFLFYFILFFCSCSSEGPRSLKFLQVFWVKTEIQPPLPLQVISVSLLPPNGLQAFFIRACKSVFSAQAPQPIGLEWTGLSWVRPGEACTRSKPILSSPPVVPSQLLSPTVTQPPQLLKFVPPSKSFSPQGLSLTHHLPNTPFTFHGELIGFGSKSS